MATRSTIAVQHNDGTVSQVYCHWDGYLSHNGKLLIENYNTLESAECLIQFGSISSLGKSIGVKHPFSLVDTKMSMDEWEEKYGNMTTFYGRDRGETDTEPKVFTDFEDYKERFIGEEYDYIFKDGQWLVSAYGRPYVTIVDAIKQEEDEEDED